MGRPLPRGRFGSTAARASAAVLAIAAGLALSGPAQAQTDTTLVSNASESRVNTANNVRATSFTTGSNSGGYTITEIQLWIGNAGLATRELSVNLLEDDSGEPGTLVAAFTEPATRAGNALNTFTAPAGTTVSAAANTTYWVTVNDGVTNVATVGRTEGNGETGVAGWTIGNSALYLPSNSDSWLSTDAKLVLVVKGTITPSPATVTIEAEHDSIGGGVEDLVFTLERTGVTMAELDATVTITQDETWLGATDLSHDVTFAANSATATLTIAWSKFSLAPTSTGTLTATVSGTGISGGSDDVEVISISDPPITISYDKASYTFAEDATNDSVYVVATLNTAYPRPPSLPSITASYSSRTGTAESRTGGGDYAAISWMGAFLASEYARAADTDPWVARKPVPDFEIHDDEVYDEGSETFTMIIEKSPGHLFDLVQFAYPDGTTCQTCSPTPAYTVTITDNDNVPPVLSLSVDPASIDDEDQVSTVDVLENVSIVTVETTNGITFGRDTTLTLTFGGTATQGTHYSVLPEDADLVATGYQVVMPSDADSVEVAVTALRNTSADGDRTVTVAGAIAGTSIGGSGTITIRNVETPVPGAPTGLTAAASGTGTINLSWTAPAEDGGSPITGYRIEVSSDGGGSWTDLVANTAGTGTTYEHTGLSAGTTRHYRVSAINANGTGSPSGTAGATTDPAADALVSNTGQADQGAMYPGLSPGNIKWSHAIGFVTGDAAGGYTLSSVQAHVGLDDAASSVQVSIYSANTSGAPASSLYVLTAPSSISTTVTLLTFTAPANATLAKETTYFVVFEAPTGQAEVRATTANAEDAGKASGWSINNLPYGRNSDTNPWSENTSSGTRIKPRIAVIGTTKPTAPDAPTGLTATADGSTAIDLAWTAPSENGGSAITGYKIEVSSDGSTWTDLVANNTGTTYSHTGLSAGTTRHYRVSAINGIGTSSPSNTASATIGAVDAVKNLGKTQGLIQAISAQFSHANAFTTGSGQTSWTLAAVRASVPQWPSGSTFTAAIHEGGSTNPGAEIATLVSPAPATGTVRFSTPGGVTLASGTTYFVVFTSNAAQANSAGVGLTSSDGEDAGALPGWSIANVSRHRSINTWTGNPNSVRMAIETISNTTPAMTVPGAPTDLTATADGATAIDLAWTAPSDNGGSAITGYKIEVSSDGGTSWTDLVANNTGTTYEHTGLSAGTTRHYRVSAINANGTGTASDTASATTGAGVTVTIEAEHESIGGGLEDLDFTLERTGATTAALDATVTITQDQTWLGASDLSHDVTFAIGSATATLTIGASKFSFVPTASGDLTAEVSGTGISGGEDVVEVVSISDPPLTIKFDMSEYTFAEDATDEAVSVVATLPAAYPRGPSRDHIQVSIRSESGTATFRKDFAPITWARTLVQGDFGRDDDADPWEASIAVPGFSIVDDDVYEGSEAFTMKLEASHGAFPSGIARFVHPDGTTCIPPFGCTPDPAYTVNITDDDAAPILSLSVDPASIAEEDVTSTPNIAENVSTVTVGTTNDKTFARDTTVTVTFSGTATQGTHYSVLPADADAVATGYQVVLPMETESVEVTVTAAGNSSADGDRTVIVTGALAGTSIGSATITIVDDDGATATVPGEPRNLTATAVGSTAIDLAWTAPSDNGGAAITGYKIEVSPDGTTWTDLVANNTGTTYSHTGLSPGTTRHYRVSAINANGTGTASGPASATTTTAGTTVPGAPTRLSATAVGSIDIILLWTAPSSDGGAAITGYKIEVSSDGTTWTDLVANTNSTTTYYEHTGLSGGTTRHYRVSAINANGTGTASGTANATTDTTVPGAPTSLTATADGSTEIDLAWTAPTDDGGSAITGYKIEVSSDGTTWTDLVANNTGTTYAHTGLSAGTTRHYRVSAINVNGTGTASGTASATTDSGPVSANALVSNINQPKYLVSSTIGTATTSQYTVAQEFTTGDNENGYALSDVVFNVSTINSGAVPKVSIYTEDGDEPDAVLYTLTNPATFSTGDMTFTAPPNATLAKETKYFVFAEGTVELWFATSTASELEGTAASGWSINDERLYRNQDADDWNTVDIPVRITINGTVTGTKTTTVPGEPTNLTATASGTGTINLSWTAPSSDGGSPITGYRIEVSPDGNSNWTNRVANTNSTGTTHSHTGLSPGTTRHYRVSAINTNGTGTASGTANATTNSATTTVPDAPTNLTATASGTARINLSWTAPSDDGGSPITGYRIEVSSDGTTWTDLVANNTGTTYSHTGLTAGTTRHYRVSAINANGTGTASSTANATTDAATTPAPVIVTDGVQVTSTPAAGDTYRLNETIEITVTFDNAVTVNTSGGTPRIQFRLDGALNRWAEYSSGSGGTALLFTYTVQSGDKDDNGIWLAENFLQLQGGTISAAADNTVDATLTYDEPGLQSEHKVNGSTVPGAPRDLTATAGGTSFIALAWLAPTDDGGSAITGYKIEVSPNGTTWTDLVANTDDTGTTYLHTGLTAGTTRHYRVSAINANGTGNASRSASATTETDEDQPGLELSKSSLTVDEGSSATYTVALATQPSAAVTVTITVNGGADVTLDPTDLTFTTTDWATAQTVTVSAAQDDDEVAAQGFLRHAGSGGGYGSVSKDLPVTVSDDDATGKAVLTMHALAGSVPAGGEAHFEIRRSGGDMGWLKISYRVDESDGNYQTARVRFRPGDTRKDAYYYVGQSTGTVTARVTGPSDPLCTPSDPNRSKCTDDYEIGSPASASMQVTAASSDVSADEALEDALAVADGLTPDEAAGALFGDVRLSEARLAALDLLGNGNGRYDLGDLLAWVDRCKRGEARCGTTLTDSPPPSAAGLAAAAAAGRPRRRTGRRGSKRRGRTPLRTARRRRGRFAGYALAALLAAATTLSCADGPAGPAAYVQDPGFLTVEWNGPEAGRGSGVLLELEGPGIEAVRAPGFDLYESTAPGRHRIVVAGPLEEGPLAQFRVPDRNQSALYRVRVIEVTGEDYQLRDPREYRAVIAHRQPAK